MGNNNMKSRDLRTILIMGISLICVANLIFSIFLYRDVQRKTSLDIEIMSQLTDFAITKNQPNAESNFNTLSQTQVPVSSNSTQTDKASEDILAQINCLRNLAKERTTIEHVPLSKVTIGFKSAPQCIGELSQPIHKLIERKKVVAILHSLENWDSLDASARDMVAHDIQNIYKTLFVKTIKPEKTDSNFLFIMMVVNEYISKIDAKSIDESKDSYIGFFRHLSALLKIGESS